MRSKGSWVSPSRDRALSYTAPQSFEVRHGELGGPVLWGVPSDVGCGVSPFAYLCSREYVGGMKDDAGGDGCPDA